MSDDYRIFEGPRMVCWIGIDNPYGGGCDFVTTAPLGSPMARDEMRAHFAAEHPGQLRPTDLVDP